MKIVCLKNGPYLVTDVINKDGTKASPIALCRCGHSATKPFCDGKHKIVNFEAEQVELDEHI
jgi:CDGSH-type Zn-finger protein